MALIGYLTSVEFEHGAIARAGELVRAQGIARPLVITDPGLAARPLLGRLRDALASLPVAVFDGTPQNPTEEAAEQALARYREADCDGIVALGGGSPIDLGKAVALMATHPGPLAQYALIEGGLARITARVAPLVAIPTTAGTGSEVGRGALLTLRDGRKLGLISPHLIPRFAICDPELTLGLPPALTAATGMDALTHCIETYLSPRVNPPADAIALDGAVRAARWIETAVTDGANRDARWQMMMAALQGGLTFQKGLGAVHSMSHPLGSIRQPTLHHGTLNAVILPTVLRWNAPAVPDKIEALGRLLGVAAGDSLDAWIARLNARLGLPAGLAAMGFDPALVPRMAQAAVADHSTATNPRPTAAADFERLFAEAMGPH